MALPLGLVIRRVIGAAGAAGLAALAGFALADRQAFEAGEVTLALFIPAAGASMPSARVPDTGAAPGRSGTNGPAARVTPDAAPPPGAGVEMARPSLDQSVRAAKAERAAAITRLSAVLDGLATDLDRQAERKLAAAIYDASRRQGIDPFLTLAVIETESSYRNGAISFLGARGLMQIRPFVGEALAAQLRIGWAGESTLHDPVANVTMGVHYLAQMRARFDDFTLALAAYNIGPNAVQVLLDEERDVPTGYVRKVLGSYARLLAAAQPLGGER